LLNLIANVIEMHVMRYITGNAIGNAIGGMY